MLTETVSLVASLILAGVLGIAGIAKLLDRPGSIQSMGDFGVPAWLARPAGLLLPIIELLLALGLFSTVTAPWAAAGALILLVIFTVAIGFQLAQGRRPTCHCFGKLSASPIGRGALVRNGVLAVLAALILLIGRTPIDPLAFFPLLSLPAWVLALIGWAVVLTIAVVVQSWLLFHLLRQHGRLLNRIDLTAAGGTVTQTMPAAPASEGLALHTPAPSLTFDTLDGQSATLTNLLRSGLPTVLLFIDPHCSPCTELLPDARLWRQQFAHLFHLVAISRGDAEANRLKTRGLAHIWLQREREALDAFHIVGTPSAVVVAPDGRIASQTVGGGEAIGQLIRATVSAATRTADVAEARHGTPTEGRFTHAHG